MISQTCTANGSGLERVRYFGRQLITADDMLAEQQYFRQKLRRHNRFLHGWGVVCGMKVIAAPDIVPAGTPAKWPWRVKVDAGYAIGPYGDEIYLAEPFCLDLATCIDQVADPCEPGQPPQPVPPKSGKVYVAIRYVECETRPVRVHSLGCSCDDMLCEFSRIRDDFEIVCLTEPPEDVTVAANLCDLLAQQQLAPCPPCPESPWLLLAKVTLPAEPQAVLADSAIDNFVRRQVFSTAVLQEQLIDCCCGQTPVPQPQPAQVIEVKPSPNMSFPYNQPPREIVVTFDKRLKPETVSKDTFVVSYFGGEVAGDVAYQHPRAVFTPHVPFNQYAGPNGAEFKIVVRGNGPAPITDVDDLNLDGDKDGTAGGNFESTFTLQPRRVPAQVIDIKPWHGESFPYSQAPREIVVTFDKKLKPETVNKNTILVSYYGGDISGDVTYAHPRAVFTPYESFNLHSGPSGADFKIVVLGGGPAPITDVDNLSLDGDKDGDPGGDFDSTFGVQPG